MITLADISRAIDRYRAIGIDKSEPKDAPLHLLAAMGWPTKVALRAIEKFERKGLLACGVSSAYPSLTEKGHEALGVKE